MKIIQLYHRYAKPLQLHEILLSIFHSADQGVTARATVEQAWSEIFKKACDQATKSMRSPFDSLSDKVRQLGKKYFPDESVFPICILLLTIAFIVNRLEQFALEDSSAPKEDWLIQTFVSIQVPHQVIFQAYHELFEKKLPPWSSNKSLQFLVRCITTLLELWMETYNLPEKLIDDCISKYLVMVQLDQNTKSRLQKIQAKIRMF